MTLLDFYSGFSLVKVLHPKSEAAEADIQMVHEVENVFSSRMKCLTPINWNVVKGVRSDGEGEYVVSVFRKWLKNRGLLLRVTTA